MDISTFTKFRVKVARIVFMDLKVIKTGVMSAINFGLNSFSIKFH
jgi:hypothetical protein